MGVLLVLGETEPIARLPWLPVCLLTFVTKATRRIQLDGLDQHHRNPFTGNADQHRAGNGIDERRPRVSCIAFAGESNVNE